MRVTELSRAAEALDIGRRSLIALVGGGGKTTLLFALGEQLPGRTLLTTTTRMGRDRTGGFECLVGPSDGELLAALDQGVPVLVWRATDERKALGYPPDEVDRWFTPGIAGASGTAGDVEIDGTSGAAGDAEVAGLSRAAGHLGIADHIVVEADGARRRPFTAPAPWEPPIPAASTHVVACIGADALGYVIADRLHRPLRVAAAAGCSPYARFTPARAAEALTSTIGMRKNVPAQARFVVAVNAADPFDEQVIELAAELERRECQSLVITPAEDVSNR